ncbi:MAG: pyridoxal-phosphate dependent enzyme [Alphaproteobacteria bacterium]|nr:pyridoxal-phosphate dependent enzyme [Alphaproteobacteria bacterium]
MPLIERLEAFEDVWESEVGDTSLVRVRSIERAFGLRQVFLKLEGDNPTGTQKDRIAFAQVYDALRRRSRGMVLATCGNYGVAAGYAARVARLRCVAVLPASYNAPRAPQIAATGAEIRREGEDYEGAVAAARRIALDEGLYDANAGGANEDLQLRAYRAIAYEIFDELRDAPAAVAAPVSNGTTLAGLHRGFLSLERRGRSSHMPRLIGGSAFRMNPIVRAWETGDPVCSDLEPTRIRETTVNEPLVNWHAIDGQRALDAIRETDGAAVGLSDRRLRDLARMLRHEQGLIVQPASTAGLAALLETHQRNPLPPARYVAVITARSE